MNLITQRQMRNRVEMAELSWARIVIGEVFFRGDYSCPFLSLNYLS